MRMALSDGLQAQIGVRYTESKLTHLRRAPAEPHKQITIRITVKRQNDVLATFEGSAYCHPNDQFVKIEGRKRALRRVFDLDKGHRVLSKSNRAAICRRLLAQFFPKKEEEVDEKTLQQVKRIFATAFANIGYEVDPSDINIRGLLRTKGKPDKSVSKTNASVQIRINREGGLKKKAP